MEREITTYDVSPANGDPIVVYNGEEAQCMGTGFESFGQVVRTAERDPTMDGFDTDGDLHIFTLGALALEE